MRVTPDLLRVPAKREVALRKLRLARDWLDTAQILMSTSQEQRHQWRRRSVGTDPDLLRADEVLGEWGAPDAIETALVCGIMMLAEARALLDAEDEVEVEVQFRAPAVPGDVLAEIRLVSGRVAK